MKIAKLCRRTFSGKSKNIKEHLEFLTGLKNIPNAQEEKHFYYRLLNVERSASSEEIKNRYKEYIRLIHPDVQGPEALKIEPEVFDLFQTAYKTLADQQKRMKYDQEQNQAIYFIMALCVLGVAFVCNYWYFPHLRRRAVEGDSINDVWHKSSKNDN